MSRPIIFATLGAMLIVATSCLPSATPLPTPVYIPELGDMVAAIDVYPGIGGRSLRLSRFEDIGLVFLFGVQLGDYAPTREAFIDFVRTDEANVNKIAVAQLYRVEKHASANASPAWARAVARPHTVSPGQPSVFVRFLSQNVPLVSEADVACRMVKLGATTRILRSNFLWRMTDCRELYAEYRANPNQEVTWLSWIMDRVPWFP